MSLVPRSANLMHVPNVHLLDTGLDEAKCKIGLAWNKCEPLDPLITTLFNGCDNLGAERYE